MQVTFNQISAAILIGLSLLMLGAIFFYTGDVNIKTICITAIVGALNSGVVFLLKASSDAQREKKDEQMINALKDSSPSKN